jgi:hypothetical protein
MRKSRVLLAGVAVAAAAAATSAFTASNTVPASVAGYGQAVVTGAVVTIVHYVPNAADPSVLDGVEFTTTTHLTAGYTATMTLRTGVAADGTGGTVLAPATGYACSEKTAWDNTAGTMVVTCDTSAANNAAAVRKFSDFNGVGLSVIS